MSGIWNETELQIFKAYKKNSCYDPEGSEVSQILFSGDDKNKVKITESSIARKQLRYEYY